MKLIPYAALLSGLLIVTPGLNAASEPEPESGKHEMGDDREDRHEAGEERDDRHERGEERDDRHEMPAERMKKRLGLSDEQAGKLKAAMEARRAAAKPLHERMRQSVDKLRDQVKSKASDGEIQATLNEIEQAHKAAEAAEDRFKADTASFLKPSQRARMWLDLMGHMRGKGRWKGRGNR